MIDVAALVIVAGEDDAIAAEAGARGVGVGAHAVEALQDADASVRGEVVLLADAGTVFGVVEGDERAVDAYSGCFVQGEVREEDGGCFAVRDWSGGGDDFV